MCSLGADSLLLAAMALAAKLLGLYPSGSVSTIPASPPARALPTSQGKHCNIRQAESIVKQIMRAGKY